MYMMRTESCCVASTGEGNERETEAGDQAGEGEDAEQRDQFFAE